MAKGLGPTLSILVVEDDLAVAELLRTILNRVPGWGATLVHDAAAAREVMRHVKIEALVLDVNLPGISGPELLQMLDDDPVWGRPPVFLISSDVGQPGVPEALHSGRAVAALQKPFDIDELVALIERATRSDLDTPAPTG
ncbi:MAG: response regulator [Chloroflexota bacterium]|nr:response regulator [Chloroflexota bacterium]